MRKCAPINVIVHYPKTETGKEELARRVAAVHADYVTEAVCKLSCPLPQKLALLDAVIKSVKQELQINQNKKAELPL